jgi:hypothetical protein
MFEMYTLAVGYGDTFLNNTGLLCHLLGIREPEHLSAHPLARINAKMMLISGSLELGIVHVAGK